MDVIRENRGFWLYVVGIILLFIILLIGASIFLRGDETNVDNNSEKIPLSFDAPPGFFIDLDKRYFAEFNTSMGVFKAELFALNSPLNVNNFVFLAQRKYFDGIKVHRMEPNVLIQMGSRLTINEDASDDLTGNPGYTVKDEVNWDSLDFSEEKRKRLADEGYESNSDVSSLPIEKYSLVMANANKKNSIGSQFFIVIADPSDPRVEYLTGRHTLIGKIIEGTSVIDEVRKIDVILDGQNNPRPATDIIINSVKITVE